MSRIAIANWNSLKPETTVYALVINVDLVIVRWPREEKVSVLYGRCLYRETLLADGEIENDCIISLHGWRYRYDSGLCVGTAGKQLHLFKSWLKDGFVWVDEDEITDWEQQHPQAYQREVYQGLFKEALPAINQHPVYTIHRLARYDDKAKIRAEPSLLDKESPRQWVSLWDSIRFSLKKLEKTDAANTDLIGAQVMIGCGAQQPLALASPLFVMHVWSRTLSAEAAQALQQGAQALNTAYCATPTQVRAAAQQCSRVMLEICPEQIGLYPELWSIVQACHIKLSGKTWAEDTEQLADLSAQIEHLRAISNGIPIGLRMAGCFASALLPVALKFAPDYLVLDIQPTDWASDVLPLGVLANVRAYFAELKHPPSLIVVDGGLLPEDFAKLLALGADAIALSESALYAIGCVGTGICHTNKCPLGIATQDKRLRHRFNIDASTKQLARFLNKAVTALKAQTHAYGYQHIKHLSCKDLVATNHFTALMAGINCYDMPLQDTPSI